MGGPADSPPSLTRESLSSSRSVVRDTWGEWLGDNWEWDWFATLTFADPKDQGTHTSVGWSLSDRLYREWVQGLADQAGWESEPYWVRAREPHQHRQSTHFHALMGGVGKLSRKEAWQGWFGRHGQARIEPVNTEGATFYVAKYINKTGGEITFSDNAGAYGKGTKHDGGDDRPFSWGARDG